MTKAFQAEPFPGRIPLDKSSDSTVPSLTETRLRSGVEIYFNPFTKDEQKQVGVKSKHRRGRTAINCFKNKKVVCVELTPKLSCIKTSQLLTASDLKNHDIADDCSNWQKGLKYFQDHCNNYDLLSISSVPVLLPDGNAKGSFTNILEDFHDVPNGSVFQWQTFFTEMVSPHPFISTNISAITVEFCQIKQVHVLRILDEPTVCMRNVHKSYVRSCKFSVLRILDEPTKSPTWHLQCTYE